MLRHYNTSSAVLTSREIDENTHFAVVTNRLSNYLWELVLLPKAVAFHVRAIRVRSLLGGLTGLLRLLGTHCVRRMER